MAKLLKNIIGGKGGSSKKVNDLGGYKPKAGDEEDFAKKHEIEKHDDRNGNGDDVFQATNVKHSLNDPDEKRHGYKKPEDIKVNESACSMTKEGTMCEVHGMKECPGYSDTSGTAMKLNEKPKKKLSEVLTKKTSAGETISDFVHSKNPKFAGKSTKERQRMALGAYYAKQRNEEVDLDEAAITGNEGHGYHGNVKAKDDAERAKHYSAMHTKVKKMAGAAGHMTDVKHPNKMVKHFLDSPHGRHIADDPSDRNIHSRFKHFKKSYKPEQHNESLAFPFLEGGADSDESAEMLKAELKALASKSMELVQQIPDSMTIEAWVQAKIAQAKAYVTDVHDYMLYGNHDKETEKEMSPAADQPMDITTASNPPNSYPSYSADVNTGRVV